MATEVEKEVATENGWEAALTSSAVGEPLCILLGSSVGWPVSQMQLRPVQP